MPIYTNDETLIDYNTPIQENGDQKQNYISDYQKDDINDIEEYGKSVKKHLFICAFSFFLSFFFIGIIISKRNSAKLAQLEPPNVDPTNLFEISLLREIEKERFLAEKISKLCILPCFITLLFIIVI